MGAFEENSPQEPSTQREGPHRQTYSDPYGDQQRLQKEYDQQKAKIESLQEALKNAETIASQVKSSAQKMQMAMDNKELFMGVQLSDDMIASKFKHLLGQVRTWSQKFQSFSSFDPGTLDEWTRTTFDHLAPGSLLEVDARPFWGNHKKVRFLIQSWVNLIITEYLFRSVSGIKEPPSAGCDLWMGRDLREGVRRIEDALSKTSKHHSAVACH